MRLLHLLLTASLVALSPPALAQRATQDEIDKARAVGIAAASRCLRKKGDITSQAMLENYVVYKLKENKLWYLRTWLLSKNADIAIRVAESFLGRNCLVAGGQETEIARAITPFIRDEKARKARGKNMEWELIYVDGEMSYLTSKDEWSQEGAWTKFFIKEEKLGFDMGDNWTFNYEIHCDGKIIKKLPSGGLGEQSYYRNSLGEWNTKRGDATESRRVVDLIARKNLGTPSLSKSNDQRHEAIYRYWCVTR